MLAVYRRPVVGKIGLSIVLCTKLGVNWLMVRRPPSPTRSASCRNGLREMTSGCRYNGLTSFTRTCCRL